MSTLYRATLTLEEADGRTLVGTAVPFDRPTRVRDANGPAYLEAFAPTSVDASLSQRDQFPLFRGHRYQEDPVGVVTFAREDEEALRFEAKVSSTAAGDEVLELVNDGAMRSVSIGFRAIKADRRHSSEGEVTYRTQIALRELSLAPTGFGAYEEALVAAVRTEGESRPVLEAMQRRAARIRDIRP